MEKYLPRKTEFSCRIFTSDTFFFLVQELNCLSWAMFLPQTSFSAMSLLSQRHLSPVIPLLYTPSLASQGGLQNSSLAVPLLLNRFVIQKSKNLRGLMVHKGLSLCIGEVIADSPAVTLFDPVLVLFLRTHVTIA